MPKIRIRNPRPGCAKFTTPGQAERLVRRGEAVLFGHELEFLSASDQAHMQRIERQIAADRKGSDVYVDPYCYEIIVRKLRSIPTGPAFPIVQFVRGC
jgi:hypothetical protein